MDMKVFLKSTKRGIDANGEYNSATKALIVHKGSVVSEHVSTAGSFRGAKTVERYRNQYVINRIVIEDVAFKSSSTAEYFVTGSSTDGTRAWKTEDGVTISSLAKKDEG